MDGAGGEVWAATGEAFVPWDGGDGFDGDALDGILVNAARQGASDVVLQTWARPVAEVAGRRWPAWARTERLGDGATIQAALRLYGPGVEAQLASGSDLNCSHAARDRDGRVYRFRANISPVLARGARGANIVVRPLPERLPELEALGLPAELEEALTAGTGLSVVTGVPGSGKSTLLAAVIRRLAERGIGRIQTYEAPIEFVYEGLGEASALVSQTEIPTHIRDFATGVRSSLRRSPAAILVGEARERATVEAALDVADFGVGVYTTTHAVGVAATIRRFLTEFPPEEREARAVAMLEALNVVATQALVPHPAGGRTAVREWLVFDAGLKRQLFGEPVALWSRRISDALEFRDATLADEVGRAIERGEAEPSCLRRFAEIERYGVGRRDAEVRGGGPRAAGGVGESTLAGADDGFGVPLAGP